MSEQHLTTTTESGPRLPALRAGGAVQPIVAQSFEDAWRIATVVFKAGMAPTGFKDIEQCMVAVMHGAEVGMTPMVALQSIAVINGRPSIWGDGALGLVQGSGKMEWHKEWFDGTPGADDYTAHFQGKRLHDPEIKHTKFSIADARVAGLWGKAGPWKTYSDRMLKMRARGFGLRDGWADVLRGLAIAEEAQDIPLRDVAPASGHVEAPPPPARAAETPRSEPEIIPPAAKPAERAQEGSLQNPGQPAAPPPPRRVPQPPPPDDGLTIPPLLDRRAETHKPEPPPAVNEAPAPPATPTPPRFDEAVWLANLGANIARAEEDPEFDLVGLGHIQVKDLIPFKGKVSKDAWDKGNRLIAECIGRLGERVR